jgi:hypothetical protein
MSPQLFRLKPKRPELEKSFDQPYSFPINIPISYAKAGDIVFRLVYVRLKSRMSVFLAC